MPILTAFRRSITTCLSEINVFCRKEKDIPDCLQDARPGIVPANKKRFGVPDGKSTITARKIDTRQRIKCFEPRKQIRYIEVKKETLAGAEGQNQKKAKRQASAQKKIDQKTGCTMPAHDQAVIISLSAAYRR